LPRLKAEIGCWLSRALLNDGRLLGMRLVRREAAGGRYQIYEESFSKKAARLFFEKARGREIRGVKSLHAFVRLNSACLQNGN
jgi:hypothetical protein